ncbi:MAG: hypothetical protein OEN52_06490, partial [Gammaproteobacteria bacterium]|nr:hypothetical protein [Gammaproteobacteria bacterium]
SGEDARHGSDNGPLLPCVSRVAETDTNIQTDVPLVNGMPDIPDESGDPAAKRFLPDNGKDRVLFPG